ncbi:MAG: protein ImuB [Paracoccaceae bacterium]|jgi:protein ImuB
MERWIRVMARSGNAPPDDTPVILAREGHHGPVIHATTRAARLAGARVGERVVDIRALCPDLQVEYGDLAGDAQALDRLVMWARRWAPWTAGDGVDGLVLDTTGVSHLFGGEAAMLIEIEARLSSLGLSAQLAMAPNWGTAWGLARFGPVRAICPDDQMSVQLAPLPVAALRLGAETLILLRRLGLKTVGSLAAVPRLSLTRRFARTDLQSNPLLRLDQALGKTPEPVASIEARPVFRAQSRLPEPILNPQPYLHALCEDLCTQLHSAGCGCRKLRLSVYHTDGDLSTLEVTTSVASRDAAHLVRLFDDRLERINPGYGFDLITLEAGGVEAVDMVQTRLEGGADDAVHLSRLIDRLTARFGSHAVTRPVMHQSHVPERAQGWGSAISGNMPVAAPPFDRIRDRPLRLLEIPEEVRVLFAVPEGPPAQFVWRRQTHQVARYAGPERIAPEWWRDRPGTRLRDYFKVEDHTGHRFWLYREGLHEDGRGGDPRWFVHGMFA